MSKSGYLCVGGPLSGHRHQPAEEARHGRRVGIYHASLAIPPVTRLGKGVGAINQPIERTRPAFDLYKFWRFNSETGKTIYILIPEDWHDFEPLEYLLTLLEEVKG